MIISELVSLLRQDGRKKATEKGSFLIVALGLPRRKHPVDVTTKGDSPKGEMKKATVKVAL